MILDINNSDDISLFHKIRFICKNKEEVYEMMLDYLSTIEPCYDIMVKRKIDEQHYSIKYLGKKSKYTTKNAILLAKKVNKELGLRLYPMIECVGRGWGSGSYVWAMASINHDVNYGSEDPVSFCLKKKVKLDITEMYNTIVAGY